MKRTFNYTDELLQYGSAQLSIDQFPHFDRDSWGALERAISPEFVHYEQIVESRTDPTPLPGMKFARLIIDIDTPKIVRHAGIDEVLKIIRSPALLEKYAELVNRPRLFVRRAQVNFLTEGGYVRAHRDTESNPDYLYAIVMHFESKYEGGEYRVHHPSGIRDYKPKSMELFISECSLLHEVLPVVSGVRKTLVSFLASTMEKNPKSLESK